MERMFDDLEAEEEQTLRSRSSFDMSKTQVAGSAHRTRRAAAGKRVAPLSSPDERDVPLRTKTSKRNEPILPADSLVVGINDSRVVFWDIFVLMLLFYEIWAVPFEIGVSGGHLWRFMGVGGLMLAETVNVVFLCDTILYFFRETRDSHGRLVWRLKDTARRYARGWFLADILSCIPVDTIAYMSGTPRGSGLSHFLMWLQTLRLSRLSRISRRLKGSPALQRFSLRFSMIPLQIAFIFLVQVYVAHCMSCLWCFLVNIQNGRTWIDKFLEQQMSELSPTGDDLSNVLDLYVIGLYWASVTLVSLGYGDVTPYTRAEFWVCAISILVSAALWAWVVASMVDLVGKVEEEKHELSGHLAVMNRFGREDRPNDPKFQQDWDSLMDEARLYLQMAHTQRQKHQSIEKLNDTLQMLSPSLRMRIEIARAESTLLRIQCFSQCRVSTLAFLASNMVELCLACGEVVVDDESDILERERGLYFIKSGACLASGQVISRAQAEGVANARPRLAKAIFKNVIQGDITTDREEESQMASASDVRLISEGDIWDLDRFILERSSPLFRPGRLLAVSYCEMAMVPKSALVQAMKMDPDLRKAVRMRIARNGLIQWAKQVKAGVAPSVGAVSSGSSFAIE